MQRSAGPIVVGVDGAEASLAAVRWAAQEASLSQARVHLVFVSLRYARALYSGTPEESPWVDGDANGTALLAAAQLEAARALTVGRVSSELAAGSPARVLIEWSATAELLVLGAAYHVRLVAGCLGHIHDHESRMVVTGCVLTRQGPVKSLAPTRALSTAPAGT